MQFRWIFYFVPWYVSPCFTTILGRIFFKKKIQATQLQDCSQIHRAHEVPKDENAPMPHAHVGTELVYATDRADLEPPFKVRYLGWFATWLLGKRKKISCWCDVMGWDTPPWPFLLFIRVYNQVTRESKGPTPNAMFQGTMAPFNSHDTIPMAPEKSSWIGRFVSGEDKTFRGSYVNVVSNRWLNIFSDHFS